MSCDEIIGFLKEREVPESCLQLLREEKVDAETILAISDDTLAKYVERLGDRVALHNYLTQKNSSSLSKQPSKRRHLFEILKEKMSKHQTVKKEERSPESNVVPAKGRKQTRHVEFGWVHNNKQVRKRQGGGLRKEDVLRFLQKKDLIQIALDLFFKDGISHFGPIEDFQVDLLDFKDTPVPENVNVADFYELYKTGILTFYLHTCTLNKDDQSEKSRDASPKDAEDLPDIPLTKTKREQSCCDSVSIIQEAALSCQVNINDYENQPCSTDTLFQASLDDTILYTAIDSAFQTTSSAFSIIDVSSEIGNIPNDMHVVASTSSLETMTSIVGSPQNSQSSTLESSQVDTCTPTMTTNTIDLLSLQALSLPDAQIGNIITIHRANIQEEMMCAFKTPDILSAKVQFHFVDEAGHEAYSLFWKSFFQTSAEGEEARVPAIFPEYGHTEWLAVGRILTKGYVEHHVFPLQLSEVFFTALVLREDQISESGLMQSFSLYLSSSDRAVVQSALLGDISEEDMEIFQEILDRESCHSIPQGEAVRATVLQMAHKCLIQNPSYALEAMRPVVEEGLKHLFPSLEAVEFMYASSKPTPKKVCDLIQASPMTKEESLALRYLMQYIRAQDGDDITRLLHFLTAATSISVKSISVQFTQLRSTGRRPVAHTRGPCLELPSTYGSYRDFRSKWDAILDSGYLRMDIA